ncbi:MAG: S-adenosylmethionine:tRNA ribosyltransferase-isomerase [Bacteroidales bacterium]|nr:S-adenosylmethionine:tRNA ribosyltransferase-isomerase [Bacteroidales bacterium]
MIPEIHIEDYTYPLPDERIAKYPLAERDASKLLIYRDGQVSGRKFRNLAEELPAGSLMIFNDTKVVPARLFFRRQTGAHIEIFCLEPDTPAEYNTNFAATDRCRWKCVIGNAKRWKDDVLALDDAGEPELAGVQLKASLVHRDGQTGIVEFCWQGGAPFSRVLELCGRVPIPPYLNRETEAIDLERYQTLYAHIRGSVAAPTAGLHFTQRVLDDIAARGIETANVCLHVGAGTFLPVKSSLVSEHPMHREPFVVSRELLCKLRDCPQSVVAVGTTSVRTLESLYYVGISCLEQGAPSDVDQWAPYEREYAPTRAEALDAIVRYLDANGLPELKVGTRIIIVPGFRFRVVDAMVTNFHQPQSTLLLLISAFVGGDWHTIYDYALANGFRFLSYGDSSLLFRR